MLSKLERHKVVNIVIDICAFICILYVITLRHNKDTSKTILADMLRINELLNIISIINPFKCQRRLFIHF